MKKSNLCSKCQQKEIFCLDDDEEMNISYYNYCKDCIKSKKVYNFVRFKNTEIILESICIVVYIIIFFIMSISFMI